MSDAPHSWLRWLPAALDEAEGRHLKEKKLRDLVEELHAQLVEAQLQAQRVRARSREVRAAVEDDWASRNL